MATKDFKFTLEDGEHTVHLEHGSISGKRSILVDGQPLTQEKKFVDSGGDYPFQINGHRGMVVIRNNGLGFKYDVAIDGVSVTSGKPVAPAIAMPGWAWVFIAICAVIPVISLGGVIPMAIGFGGAFGCAQAARDGAKDHNTRLLTCAGIAVVCWGVFVAFLFAASAVING